VSEWIWVDRPLALSFHDSQIAEHGGLPDVRDENAIENALARPQNKAAYEQPDAADLAAAYLFDIARNHPFFDGNKRTAWVVAATFLFLNGYDLHSENPHFVGFTNDVAAGTISETQAAEWFRVRLMKKSQPRG
jgi:death-on-curing protein